ncbi:MAG: hypothetical protein RMK29_11750 [Myxococcales bacterium]|nr:hypothetical protein [Myxococcota bacterium]MDW8282382.1 hypothetical protein [Myxococcales bacterium]
MQTRFAVVVLALLAAPARAEIVQPPEHSGPDMEDPAREPGPSLPAHWQAALQTIRQDPPPPALIRNSHYIISNEDRPHAFRAVLEDRGGIYIGVGSEQNYLLAGWARPELIFLVDFDQLVVDLHRVYRVLMREAPDPQAFLDLWKPEQEDRVRALLAAAYPGDPSVLRAYRRCRFSVPARLHKMRRILSEAGVPSFLDDPAQYRYLASMQHAGRVIALRGDLTGAHTLRDIAAAARATEQPVRVIYLSNAERYFPYGANFKANIQALPFDEHSLVLRTAARLMNQYVYIVQDGMAFQAWLRRPDIQRVWQITRLRDRNPAGEADYIRRLPH